MNYKKNLLLILFLVFSVTISRVGLTKDGDIFLVTGEQIQLSIPAGWKLAWMSGEHDGGYVAEYIPNSEDINSWREGYLAIQRFKYPPATAMKELEMHKARMADVALDLYQKNTKSNCGGNFEDMVKRSNTFNDVYVAVSGGYCDKYGPEAPFGEGAFVAMAEGKDYWFRIQYAWRPKSLESQKENLPWRISRQKAEEYLTKIKAVELCGGTAQLNCKSVNSNLAN